MVGLAQTLSRRRRTLWTSSLYRRVVPFSRKSESRQIRMCMRWSPTASYPEWSFLRFPVRPGELVMRACAARLSAVWLACSGALAWCLPTEKSCSRAFSRDAVKLLAEVPLTETVPSLRTYSLDSPARGAPNPSRSGQRIPVLRMCPPESKWVSECRRPMECRCPVAQDSGQRRPIATWSGQYRGPPKRSGPTKRRVKWRHDARFQG